jgi:hypothetical protein
MSAIMRLIQRFTERTEPSSCDNCAFVEFFRSTGDGQMSRLNAFCRCPGGDYEDRPVPQARRCERWQRSAGPVPRPSVGDPTLSV